LIVIGLLNGIHGADGWRAVLSGAGSV
jgi:hypothetical protein